MKLKITLLAATLAAASTFVARADNHVETRVLSGGRNAPNQVTIAVLKKADLANKSTVTRTEVLAGGRNAPHQVRPVSEAIQIAPAVQK